MSARRTIKNLIGEAAYGVLADLLVLTLVVGAFWIGCLTLIQLLSV